MSRTTSTVASFDFTSIFNTPSTERWVALAVQGWKHFFFLSVQGVSFLDAKELRTLGLSTFQATNPERRERLWDSVLQLARTRKDSADNPVARRAAAAFVARVEGLKDSPTGAWANLLAGRVELRYSPGYSQK